MRKRAFVVPGGLYAPDLKKVYIQPREYSARDHLLFEVVQTLAQDLFKTIDTLQNTAIGNCRKRIDEAAAKTKGIIGSDSHDDGAVHPRQDPSRGVTSILKEKHGL